MVHDPAEPDHRRRVRAEVPAPVPLPDISFFEFWEYLPHNSVLWVWLKIGFFGFVAMLFLFARAVQHGTRSALSVRTPSTPRSSSSACHYVVMFLVFAYVDIAWDIRSTVFLGARVRAVRRLPNGRRRAAPVRPRGPAQFEMVPQ